MLHDSSKQCAGLNGPESTSRHVMAPVMAHVDPEEPWSPCSARFITDFLDNGYGKQLALPLPCAGRSSCPPDSTVLPLLPHPTWAKLTPSNMPPLRVGCGEKHCCLRVVPTSSQDE